MQGCRPSTHTDILNWRNHLHLLYLFLSQRTSLCLLRVKAKRVLESSEIVIKKCKLWGMACLACMDAQKSPELEPIRSARTQCWISRPRLGFWRLWQLNHGKEMGLLTLVDKIRNVNNLWTGLNARWFQNNKFLEWASEKKFNYHQTLIRINIKSSLKDEQQNFVNKYSEEVSRKMNVPQMEHKDFLITNLSNLGMISSVCSNGRVICSFLKRD